MLMSTNTYLYMVDHKSENRGVVEWIYHDTTLELFHILHTIERDGGKGTEPKDLIHREISNRAEIYHCFA